MHASTSVRQSVVKPRTSPKGTPSAPVDITVNSSRLDANPWSTVRSHFLHSDRNRYKGHSPRIDVPESSASPPACICSPTTHQGSFRCRLHRETQKRWPNAAAAGTSPGKASLDDEIFVETRTSSTPGSQVPRAHAVTVVPAIPKNAATPSLSASGSGSPEILTRGVSVNPRSATTSEPSASSLNSPSKTSRLRRMASAEDLVAVECANEGRDLN